MLWLKLPSLLGKISCSKELVDDIAHKTTFANMKKDSSANMEWVKKFQRPEGADFLPQNK